MARRLTLVRIASRGTVWNQCRLTAPYLFNMRQGYQLRNFEAVLRRDLSAVMSHAMDDQLVKGNGQAANVSGFLAELTAASDPGTTETFAPDVEKFTGAVDGLNAYTLGDLRAVLDAASYEHMYTQYRSNNSDLPAYEAVASRGAV